MSGSRFSCLGALLVGVSMLALSPATAAEELNALVWCDHTDPALIEPFEKANDVKVNLKVFEGTGAGLSLLDQSQAGDWDVMVIDSIDVPRIATERFMPLADDSLPLANQFPEVRMDDALVIDGKRYAVTEKWGFNAISYNKKAFSAEDVSTLDKLTDPKFAGRIAIYDYYLPVLGMASVATGTPTKDFSAETLPAAKELMLKLKKNAKLVGEVVASQTAIATGEVDVVIGAGEWVTAGLHAENPDLDFVVPAEGGILWAQSLAILKDSKKPDLALKFVQYVLSPEGQAALSTSSCYWGMPAQKDAALNDEQKQTLKFSSDVQAKELAASNRYPAPSAELDKQMQDAWNDILQAN